MHMAQLPGCIVSCGKYSIQICCRVNARQLGERLRKVPEMLAV